MHYINGGLYPYISNRRDIYLKIIEIKDAPADKNCYMYYCIALFIYKNIKFHRRVRNEIANYLLANHLLYKNINIPIEEGDKQILDYINWMRIDGKWRGELEIYYMLHKIYIILI